MQSISKIMLTERMIKNDTVLEHLNETYIAYIFFTKPARTFACYIKLNFFEKFQQQSIFNCIRK